MGIFTRAFKMLSWSVEVFGEGLLTDSQTTLSGHQWSPKWTLHRQPEGKNRNTTPHSSPFVHSAGSRLNTTLKKMFMNHWLATVISSDKMVFQVPTPHHSLLDQLVGNRERWSSQNQSKNDWVELNQWSAGRQVCYLQDGTTWRDNFHARTCIYYSAGYHEQSSRNDGALSDNSSKFSGNAVPVWTWPNKPVCVAVLPGRNVWPSGQTTFNGWGKRSFWFSKGRWDVFLKGVKFLCLGFFLMKLYTHTECCTINADLIQSLCCLP